MRYSVITIAAAVCLLAGTQAAPVGTDAIATPVNANEAVSQVAATADTTSGTGAQTAGGIANTASNDIDSAVNGKSEQAPKEKRQLTGSTLGAGSALGAGNPADAAVKVATNTLNLGTGPSGPAPEKRSGPSDIGKDVRAAALSTVASASDLTGKEDKKQDANAAAAGKAPTAAEAKPPAPQAKLPVKRAAGSGTLDVTNAIQAPVNQAAAQTGSLPTGGVTEAARAEVAEVTGQKQQPAAAAKREEDPETAPEDGTGKGEATEVQGEQSGEGADVAKAGGAAPAGGPANSGDVVSKIEQGALGGNGAINTVQAKVAEVQATAQGTVDKATGNAVTDALSGGNSNAQAEPADEKAQ
ncbi:hypothetical protein BCR43DRAFT_490689 [Syncephalastrum racemosum]|uniref:Uncharacterized protein n=1 Tax=Syncephalastrum racemosum TaxID=13706 RepID=A0A1X2HGE4_SYNRA|nr:hypothetical protein BCR43DRAFT_490689 [Syncephalastrum racemosum]